MKLKDDKKKVDQDFLNKTGFMMSFKAKQFERPELVSKK